MNLKLAAILTLLPIGTAANAEAYIIADRLIPSELKVLGISGLYTEGCPSAYSGCSNIVVNARIDRIGYVEGEDFPSVLSVTDMITGYQYSVQFPYQKIWNDIGTADVGWIGKWLNAGDRVTIIGVIGGSSGMITIDSIYSTAFLSSDTSE